MWENSQLFTYRSPWNGQPGNLILYTDNRGLSRLHFMQHHLFQRSFNIGIAEASFAIEGANPCKGSTLSRGGKHFLESCLPCNCIYCPKQSWYDFLVFFYRGIQLLWLQNCFPVHKAPLTMSLLQSTNQNKFFSFNNRFALTFRWSCSTPLQIYSFCSNIHV